GRSPALGCRRGPCRGKARGGGRAGRPLGDAGGSTGGPRRYASSHRAAVPPGRARASNRLSERVFVKSPTPCSSAGFGGWRQQRNDHRIVQQQIGAERGGIYTAISLADDQHEAIST